MHQSSQCMCLMENLLTDTHQKLRVTSTLHDSAGNDSEGIVGLEVGKTGSQNFEIKPYIFTALKAQDGNFGDKHSGIGVIIYDHMVKEEVKKN